MEKPRLLSGGNPQIPKGDGDVPVQAYIAASLRPVPPVASRHEHVRYFHIHEDDELEEGLLARWLDQASALPGEELF